jgi:hypothetical protein
MKSRSTKRKKILVDKIEAFCIKIETATEHAKDKLQANTKKLTEKLALINANLDSALA